MGTGWRIWAGTGKEAWPADMEVSQPHCCYSRLAQFLPWGCLCNVHNHVIQGGHRKKNPNLETLNMQACGAQQHMTGSLRTVGCVAGGLTSLPTTQGRSQECFARPQILREECGTMQVPPERDDDSTGHSTQRQPGQHDPYYGEFRGQPRGPQVLGCAWESMRKRSPASAAGCRNCREKASTSPPGFFRHQPCRWCTDRHAGQPP